MPLYSTTLGSKRQLRRRQFDFKRPPGRADRFSADPIGSAQIFCLLA
jgi:hypothetical protein